LLIVIPALQLTVKPALGDHPFVKLKVVAQNRWWSRCEGSLLGQVLSQYNKNCTYQLCKRQLVDNVIIVGRYWLSAKRRIVADTNYRLIISASLLDIQLLW